MHDAFVPERGSHMPPTEESERRFLAIERTKRVLAEAHALLAARDGKSPFLALVVRVMEGRVVRISNGGSFERPPGAQQAVDDVVPVAYEPNTLAMSMPCAPAIIDEPLAADPVLEQDPGVL
jgi:hypothetical protein